VTERVVKVPDVGEGVAEAELVEWHVAVGDFVAADQPLADVMTDKATVEIPSPVDGTVAWMAGEPGDVLAVGSELVRITTEPPRTGDDAPAPVDAEAQSAPTPPVPREPDDDRVAKPAGSASEPEGETTEAAAPSTTSPLPERPRAAPAVRLRALEAGIDLRLVAGTGPAGRVTHTDLDAYLAATDDGARPGPAPIVADDGVEERKLIGLRRRIAQRMAEANAHVPHITYVEEVDLTLLQQLRASINADSETDGRQPKLTLLPFLVAALVHAVRAHPQCNARFDDREADGTGVLHVHRGVHVGIATQTPNGLMVPVLRHAETRDLFATADEIERLAAAARDGTATAAELTGSTITITSLGALGGLVTTPIVNRPEVAIVGVNKLQVRPVWDGAAFAPRTMMNLSSSFDHRIVDGWDAAQFVRHIKRHLEAPAALLMGTGG
jgi:2-oxoisovalerate dehydrogenase E2 component (dihydrolipoyl transacylase)